MEESKAHNTITCKSTGSMGSHGIGDGAGKEAGEIRPDARGKMIIKQRSSMIISMYQEDNLG